MAKSAADAFYSHHRQGFVRVAAATPRVGTGDPAFNLDEHIALARQGDAEAVDLMVFPELSLSAYAIDDLLLQDPLQDVVKREAIALIDASADLLPILLGEALRPVARFRREHRAVR